jgi:hypothetical protein
MLRYKYVHKENDPPIYYSIDYVKVSILNEFAVIKQRNDFNNGHNYTQGASRN